MPSTSPICKILLPKPLYCKTARDTIFFSGLRSKSQCPQKSCRFLLDSRNPQQIEYEPLKAVLNERTDESKRNSVGFDLHTYVLKTRVFFSKSLQKEQKPTKRFEQYP